MRFVDINILLYVVGLSAEDAVKCERARELLAEPELALSVQFLQEFYHQATRPGWPVRPTHGDAVRFLKPLLGLPIQPVTVDVFRAALTLRERFGLSYWDSAILAAARAKGCDAVYSQDMSATQDYDGLRVIDPFAGSETARRCGPI